MKLVAISNLLNSCVEDSVLVVVIIDTAGVNIGGSVAGDSAVTVEPIKLVSE